VNFFVSYDTTSITLAAQELEIYLNIVDDKSGFQYGNIILDGPTGKESYIGFGSYQETYDGSDIYKVNISPNSLNYIEGEYSISSVSATDYAGNTSKYDSTWFADNNIDTTFYNGIGKQYAPDWFIEYDYGNYNNNDWMESNPLLPAPSIDTIAITDSTALSSGNGGTLTFIVSGKNIKGSANDQNFNPTYININFTDESTWNSLNLNLEYSKTISGNAGGGLFEYTASISEFAQGGNYVINNIWSSNNGYDEEGEWKNNNVSYHDWSMWKPTSETEITDWGSTVYADLSDNIKNLNIKLASNNQDLYKPEVTDMDFKVISLKEASSTLYNTYLSLYSQIADVVNAEETKYQNIAYAFGLKDLLPKLTDPEYTFFAQASLDVFDDSSGLNYANVQVKNKKSNKDIYFYYDSKNENQSSGPIKAQLTDIWKYWDDEFATLSSKLLNAQAQVDSDPNYYPNNAWESTQKLQDFIGWNNFQSVGLVDTGSTTNKSLKWISKFDKYAAEGDFSVDNVNVTDNAGKNSYYQKDAFEIESWSYQDNFVNPYSDVDPPQLDMISIQSKLDTLKIESTNGALKINLKSDSTIKTWLKDLGNYGSGEKWESYEAYEQEKQFAYTNISWSDLDLASLSSFYQDGGYLDWNLVDVAAVLSNKKNLKYANQIDWWNVGLDGFNSVSWDANLFKKAFKYSSGNLNVILNSNYFNSIKDSPGESKKFFKSLVLNNFDGLYSKTYENIDWAYFAPSKWDDWIYKSMNFNKVQFDEFSNNTYKKFNWNLMSLGSVNAKTSASIDWNKVDLNSLISDYQGGTSKSLKSADFEKINFSQLSQKSIKKLGKALNTYVDSSVALMSDLAKNSAASASDAFDVFLDNGASGVSIDLSTDSGPGDAVVLNKKSKAVSIYGFDYKKDSLSFLNISVGDSGLSLKNAGDNMELLYKGKLLATLYGSGKLTSDQIFS